jgi:metal-responsive CopG/Arc/MetJ family transcriptional regulator
MEQIIATISIWIQGRETASYDVNKILTQSSNLVLSRMGYNVEPKCSADCLAVICVVVRGEQEELETLNNQLGNTKGVKSVLSIMS